MNPKLTNVSDEKLQTRLRIFGLSLSDMDFVVLASYDDSPAHTNTSPENRFREHLDEDSAVTLVIT